LVDEKDVPPRHHDALSPPIKDMENMGFRFEFYYSIRYFGPVTHMGAALTNGDRLCLALLGHSEPKDVLKRIPPAYGFNSLEEGGLVLATSGGQIGSLRPEPEVQLVRLRHSTVDQVYEHHKERLRSTSIGLLALQSEDVPALLLERMQRTFDYNIKRGVFVPLTEGEAVEFRIRMRRSDRYDDWE
jgi:hypothetical protein